MRCCCWRNWWRCFRAAVWPECSVETWLVALVAGCEFHPPKFISITLWLFNIAMENGPFVDDFPIKTSIYKGFSMAMLNKQMVLFKVISCGFFEGILWWILHGYDMIQSDTTINRGLTITSVTSGCWSHPLIKYLHMGPQFMNRCNTVQSCAVLNQGLGWGCPGRGTGLSQWNITEKQLS